MYNLAADICEIGRRMYQRELVASNDGNISIRVDKNKLLITPTLTSKGFMKAEDIILIEVGGKYTYNPLDKPNLKSSVLADRLKTVLTLFSTI